MSEVQFRAKYQPLNEAPPSKDDVYNDECLAQFMERHIILESDANMNKRNETLEEINRMFVSFIRKVAQDKMNMTEDEAKDTGGLIFISGSHRLNVREPGADIDTVCVAPAFCTKEDFFTTLKESLLKHPDVAELNAVETAHVPVMELEFCGISIDLLFARLGDNIVRPDLDILDDRILRNLDSATEKSLNGPRVTDMISKLVPNYDTFLIVLRCARKWAKARGLYGNKFGYLGGVNFNILVAFIGHLYPKGSPSFILNKFFAIYAKWDWTNPIELIESRENDPSEYREVWHHYEKTQECMPIITPAYPAMNSSFNVNLHSRQVMVDEWKRGAEVTKRIYDTLKKTPKKELTAERMDEVFMELFKPSDFFVKYHHYIRCNIIGGEDEECARGFVGFVESRLRRLVTNLDPLPILRPVHLFPVKNKMSGNNVCYFIGFNADTKRLRGEKELLLDKAVNKFKTELDKYSGPRSAVNDQQFSCEHYSWKQLPKELFDSLGGRAEAKKLRREIFPKKAGEVTAAEAEGKEGESLMEGEEEEERKEEEGEEEGEGLGGTEGDGEGGYEVGVDERGVSKRTAEQAGMDDEEDEGDDDMRNITDLVTDGNLPAFLAWNADHATGGPLSTQAPPPTIGHVRWKLLDMK